jgi:hypothetical protein
MKKANKAHNVYDFIIFLKAKIAIIILGTLLFSALAIYTQVNYLNYWEVKVSRTVDRSAVMDTIVVIKKKTVSNEMIYDLNKLVLREVESIDPINLTLDLNKFINSLMVNVLSNQDIKYTGIINTKKEEDVFKKQNYELVIKSQDIINEDLLKKKLNGFFLDIKKTSNQILKIQHDIDQKYDFKIYDFKIDEITNFQGYDYVKILKIILINFLLITFFLYVYHLRKFIRIV